MFERISIYYNKLIIKFKLEAFKEIIIFMAIILSMHLLWRLWGRVFDYKILGHHVLNPVFQILTDNLRNVSAWVSNVIGIETVIMGDYLVHTKYSLLGVTMGCSGLKQYYQIGGLLMLYPGPWKKKLWYIPVGFVVIYFTNVFRIVALYAVVIYKFEWFYFLHDWVARPLFYVIIFLLWVLWVERLAVKKEAKN
ncbi:MAG: exosortase/archaeosortase family protein [Bacteroidota bacterium]|nr:exosortase/archaeosortase family protein [Bacteroidota bacterium]